MLAELAASLAAAAQDARAHRSACRALADCGDHTAAALRSLGALGLGRAGMTCEQGYSLCSHCPHPPSPAPPLPADPAALTTMPPARLDGLAALLADGVSLATSCSLPGWLLEAAAPEEGAGEALAALHARLLAALKVCAVKEWVPARSVLQGQQASGASGATRPTNSITQTSTPTLRRRPAWMQRLARPACPRPSAPQTPRAACTAACASWVLAACAAGWPCWRATRRSSARWPPGWAWSPR